MSVLEYEKAEPGCYMHYDEDYDSTQITTLTLTEAAFSLSLEDGHGM